LCSSHEALDASKRHGALLTYPAADDLVAGCFGGLVSTGTCALTNTGIAP